MITRAEAHALVVELVPNINLRKHMYCVEAAMEDYAERLGQDKAMWGIAGLLHDADWEAYPEVHPKEIIRRLEEMDKAEPGKVPQEMRDAIASHGSKTWSDGHDHEESRFIARKTLIDHYLYACDELSGFIVACALVNPEKLGGVKVESVIKKMKDKGFAKGVNRDDILEGLSEIGITMEEHVANVLASLLRIRSELAL